MVYNSFFKWLIIGDNQSRFGSLHPFIRNQKLMDVDGPITKNTYKKSCIVESLSEHGSKEERFAMKSPLSNENIGSCESNRNTNNVKSEEDDEHYDASDSLRNAYRIFLENSVVAALAGIL